MKYLLFASLLLVCVMAEAQPKKRSECFFGIHFDFHATLLNKEIGKNFTAERIDSFLNIVKPDFIQVDCKGHPGHSSYPTTVGNKAGGYTKDILKIWREVTTKHNVALYVHYSGIMDAKAVTDHPDWARVLPDGTADKERASYLGGYSEKLLIPQLKEISDYGVNGAWVDGECWATYLDYSPTVIELFRKETGIQMIPKSSADAHYKEYVEFTRRLFRQYLRHYVDAIHAYNPNFQITSNWSFSSLMPEPVDVNVDYLSGDVAGQNGVYSAAYQARCLALQGKPWDLMSWGFTYDFSTAMYGPKSLVQLEQEAAEVISMGGGYQSYFTQNPDGSIKPWYFSLMGELGKFCRARQPYCKNAVTIPQIGLWYSTHSKRKQTDQVYGWSAPNVEAILSMLLDGQNTVEILYDHQIKTSIDTYPLIVIPEWTDLNAEWQELALNYVKKGGNLIVIGSKAVKTFEPTLGVHFTGSPENKVVYLGMDNQISGIKTSVQAVVPNPGTKVIGEIYSTDDFQYGTGNPVATVCAYGKGKIAGFYTDISSAYYTYQARGYLKIMNKLINDLVPGLLVKIKGSDYVHTTLAQKKGKWFIHFINAAGAHFNNKVYEYDTIPATGELQVFVKTSLPVKLVLHQPDGRILPFIKKQGGISVTVPSVALHSILQIEF